MTSDTNLMNDEIDLRDLLQTLFHYKWVILGVTVLVAVVVLIFFKFITPRSYTANAQVIFTKPLSSTNLETQIQTTPQTPEPAVLKELAEDNALLWNVYNSAPVSAVIGDKVKFDKFKTDLSAKLTGTSKLYLSVSDKDSNTAAIVANEWAGQFITQTNALYSMNQNTLTSISREVQDARQRWDTTEQALQKELPEVDARKIELDNIKSTYNNYLHTIMQLDLIVQDATSLQERLKIWPDSSQLAIEYQISLINIFQRAASGLSGSPIQGIQVQVAPTSVDNTRTVAEANASLDGLIKSLGDEEKLMKDALGQLQTNISDANLAYEEANYQLTQLTTERDLALNAYQALSGQQEETRIDLARKDVVAKLAGKALPPGKQNSNGTLMKTVVAAALAFAVSCFGVLFIHWWKSPPPAKPAA